MHVSPSIKKLFMKMKMKFASRNDRLHFVNVSLTRRLYVLLVTLYLSFSFSPIMYYELVSFSS